LVSLSRDDADRQLFAAEIGSRELETLSSLGLVLVDHTRILVRATGLQLFEGVLGEVFFRLAGGVVVGRHDGQALRSLVGLDIRTYNVRRADLFPWRGHCAPSPAGMHLSARDRRFVGSRRVVPAPFGGLPIWRHTGKNDGCPQHHLALSM